MSEDDSKVPLPDLENGGMQTLSDIAAMAPAEADSVNRGLPTWRRCSMCR